MERKSKIDEVRRLRDEGYTAAKVAQMLGISRARVYQLSRAKRRNGFLTITEETNIYPNWRNWMNENCVSVRMFIEQMGLELSSASFSSVYGWMKGKCYPTKKNIDRILQATGLTYEQLFYLEETVQ